MHKPLTAFALLSIALLTACGFAPNASNSAQSGTAPFSNPTMAFTSRHAPAAIASCLTNKIGSMHRTAGGATTVLAIGDEPAWRITLTPVSQGTTVNVLKSASSDGPVPEPEMRFHIARCSI